MDWAEALGLECRVGTPHRTLPSRQASLRAARYAFLHAVSEQEDVDRIATAHHADDQAETVLFRILRGTGVRGLSGIPERRGEVVRPLLEFWRQELESYLQETGVPYLTDPSNVDPRWTRALIRTRVLPALESAWDGPVRERLVQLARSARRTDRAMLVQARQALQRSDLRADGRGFRFVRSGLAGYHPAVQARALAALAERLNVRLSRGGTRVAVEFITRGRSGASVDVGGGLELRREFDELRLGSSPDEAGFDEGSVPFRIEAPGSGESSVTLAGREFHVRWSRTSERTAGGFDEEGEDSYSLQEKDARWPIEVRGWMPGDRIRLKSGSRKLKRLFGDRRIPLSERSRIPVLSDAEGRVLWVWRVAKGSPPARRSDGGAGFTIEIREI